MRTHTFAQDHKRDFQYIILKIFAFLKLTADEHCKNNVRNYDLCICKHWYYITIMLKEELAEEEEEMDNEVSLDR